MQIKRAGNAWEETQKSGLKKLWARQDVEGAWKEFRHKQRRGALLGGLLGLLLILGVTMEMGNHSAGALQVKRPEVSWRTKKYEITVAYKGQKKRLALQVKGKDTKAEEWEQYFVEAKDLFWKQMLGENEEDRITKDLDFSGTAKGTDFTAVFRPEAFHIIGADGKLLKEEGEKEAVKIYMDIQGGEETRSYEKTFFAYPKEHSEEERLEAFLENAEKEDRSSEIVKLPEEFEGSPLVYEEGTAGGSWPLACIGVLLLPALLWYLPVQRQKEALKKRERQLLEDYPELVLKLSLLLRAGLTIRNAWQKIGLDYEKRKKKSSVRYAYEEVWQSACRIRAGVSEREEYQNFGIHCGLHPYLRLSALLEQNLQKGNKSLFSLLQAEQLTSFEERKNQIRKLGEEAGTRLLGPMMLYFLMVLVLLLVPAWMSFSI